MTASSRTALRSCVIVSAMPAASQLSAGSPLRFVKSITARRFSPMAVTETACARDAEKDDCEIGRLSVD
jgi:hypothetical protein